MYGHQYTAEEREFMEKFALGHSHREIADAFTEKFGWEISVGQVKSSIARWHLYTGKTGRFQKGQEPPNKGVKMSADVYEKCAPTMFQKGSVPAGHREVGSERVNVDGYVEVKVAEPNKWELKHRVVWESVNGPVPKGCAIIFRDSDKTNTDIRNLMMIRRGTLAVLNHTGLCEYSGELKDAAVRIAELKSATNAARKKRRENRGNEENRSNGIICRRQ